MIARTLALPLLLSIGMNIPRGNVCVSADDVTIASAAPTPSGTTTGPTPPPFPTVSPAPTTESPSGEIFTTGPTMQFFNLPPPSPEPTNQTATPAPSRRVQNGWPSAAPSFQPSSSSSPTTVSDLMYFEEPRLLWNMTLPPRKDQVQGVPRWRNAVQVCPEQTFVYVTCSNGMLYILSAITGGVVKIIDIPPFAEGWTVDSESGVDFFIDDEDESKSFAIYAVRDIPFNTTQDVQSRLVAVSYGTRELLWTSPPMKGKVVGTPRLTTSGTLAYVVHNANFGSIGHFTVLSMTERGAIVFDEVGAGLPYAPLALVKNPLFGNFDRGIGNGNDVAVWGTSAVNQTTSKGAFLAFQLPANFKDSGVISFTDTSTFATVVLGTNSWHTLARPATSSEGISVIVPTDRAEVLGWVAGQRWSQRRSWKVSVDKDEDDRRQPPFSGGTLSPDGSVYLLPSPRNSLFALDTNSGGTIWSDETGSISFVEPKTSRDGRRVYSIEAAKGTVTARRTSDGLLLWSINCTTYLEPEKPTCEGTVEAEFSLNMPGKILYYGDIMGRIVALELAKDSGPTPEPTTSIPVVAPTPAPVDGVITPPTPKPFAIALTPDPTKLETNEPSASMGPSNESQEPSEEMSENPTVATTTMPSEQLLLTGEPSEVPSWIPSISPSVIPSIKPSAMPQTPVSALPTISPSLVSREGLLTQPPVQPSTAPSPAPSILPSGIPTSSPTASTAKAPKTPTPTEEEDLVATADGEREQEDPLPQQPVMATADNGFSTAAVITIVAVAVFGTGLIVALFIVIGLRSCQGVRYDPAP